MYDRLPYTTTKRIYYLGILPVSYKYTHATSFLGNVVKMYSTNLYMSFKTNIYTPVTNELQMKHSMNLTDTTIVISGA